MRSPAAKASIGLFSEGDGMEALLDIRRLSTTLASPDEKPVEVLRGMNLAVNPAEVVCLVGESGSGKSVLARSVMGLLDARTILKQSGEIRFEGENLLGASERRLNALRGKRISMVFQDPMTSLNPVYTVGEQMTDLLRLHDPKLTAQDRRKKAAELLDSVGIPEPERVLANYPFQISGGMRQRVMIAMAVAFVPKLLIADEPTTALDVSVERQIIGLLNDLRKRTHMALLFITHDLALAYEIADRIAVCEKGRIVEFGSREDVFRRPQAIYTKKLLNSLLRI